MVSGSTGLLSLQAAGILAITLLFIQIPAAFLLLSRLSKGPGRRLPIVPHTTTPDQLGKVSVVVPTLNERERLTPCLIGLSILLGIVPAVILWWMASSAPTSMPPDQGENTRLTEIPTTQVPVASMGVMPK